MALAENFRRQVDLLLRTVPFIAKETCFALKGGTAINLFFRDLPRLSVDACLRHAIGTVDYYYCRRPPDRQSDAG